MLDDLLWAYLVVRWGELSARYSRKFVFIFDITTFKTHWGSAYLFVIRVSIATCFVGIMFIMLSNQYNFEGANMNDVEYLKCGEMFRV